MDDALRTLERRLRAAEGDLALAREYRAALERLDPERAGPLLDELQGALAVTRAVPRIKAEDRALRPTLVPVGGHEPLLRPRGPYGLDGRPPAALEERWRVAGELCWASAAVVLVEAAERQLEARCPRTGRLLWAVPSAGPHARPDEIEDTERTTILPWAAAPWGAVTLGARFEARLEAPRRGSASWRPRAVERGLPERGAVRVALTLQVAVAPGGAWTTSPPLTATERAERGEPLAGGGLVLDGWEADLHELELDPRSPSFAVSAEPDLAWSAYEVGEAGSGRAWVAGAAWEHESTEARGERQLQGVLPLDAGSLVRTRRDGEPVRLWTAGADGALVPCPVRLARGDLDTFDLVFWHERWREDEVDRPRWATALPVSDLLLVQAGGEVIALGAAT